MKNSSTKSNKKPVRQIIVLKGEIPGASFTRKQAADAVENLEREQKLARKRAQRQAKFNKQQDTKNKPT